MSMIGKVRLSMIATAAIAALALAACSSSASGSGAGSGDGSSPAAGSPGGNAADSALPAVTIGYINEDSGPNGQLDSPNGATATVKYINAELGGVGKPPGKLVKCFSDRNAQALQEGGQHVPNDDSMV